jgi:hypothetical protein
MDWFLAILVLIVIAVIVLLVRRRLKIRKIVPKRVDLPREKSLAAAYFLWAIFGLLGAHRYFLSRYLTAVAYMLVIIIAFIMGVTVQGQTMHPSLVLIGLLIVAWLLDGFFLRILLRNTNRIQWQNWLAKYGGPMESSGTVRDLSQRQTDIPGHTKEKKQIINFRVEETDDEGSVVKVVEVELIGNWITGNLRNGDMVRVPGRMSKENILRAVMVENKTTNSVMTVSF